MQTSYSWLVISISHLFEWLAPVRLGVSEAWSQDSATCLTVLASRASHGHCTCRKCVTKGHVSVYALPRSLPYSQSPNLCPWLSSVEKPIVDTRNNPGRVAVFDVTRTTIQPHCTSDSCWPLTIILHAPFHASHTSHPRQGVRRQTSVWTLTAANIRSLSWEWPDCWPTSH